MVVNEFLSWRRLLKNRELPVAEPADRPSDEDIGAPAGPTRRRLAITGGAAAAATRRPGAPVLRGPARRRDRRTTRVSRPPRSGRTPPAGWRSCATICPPRRSTEMARLTDEDLERLLRETFADKENLVDSCRRQPNPVATSARSCSRPPRYSSSSAASCTASAAAPRSGSPGPRSPPPRRTTPTSGPPPSWRSRSGPASQAGVSAVPGRWRRWSSAGPRRSSIADRKFSAVEKKRIGPGGQGGRLPVEWDGRRLLRRQCVRERRRRSRVVDKGDHKEVGATITYNCGHITRRPTASRR